MTRRPRRWTRSLLTWRRLPRRQRARRAAAAIGFGLLTLLWLYARGDRDERDATWKRRDILDALRWVESSGRPDDQVPDGDDGLAIGPYQIHRVYWQDAHTYDPTLGGAYQDCRVRGYAERVIDAYMRRHAPEAWQLGKAERLARTHNGGPTGHLKRATEGYWRRVRARLPAPNPKPDR